MKLCLLLTYLISVGNISVVKRDIAIQDTLLIPANKQDNTILMVLLEANQTKNTLTAVHIIVTPKTIEGHRKHRACRFFALKNVTCSEN